ncbi:MAG: CPBP family intramembrane glutamic endopeptidase [Acidimicrobiia bacterium]
MTPAVLVVAFVAVALDVGSAWSGQPSWAIGGVLVSPALPVAALLVLLVGWARVGGSRRSLSAWREYLVGGSLTALVVALAYAQSIAGQTTPGWRKVEGVTFAATSEEIVYRLAAVLLIGAACARICGRDWRDTARWGTGPVVVALVGGALAFSALPGHVEQMTGATSIVPFASLAMLLGYVTFRTGSLLPGIVVHVLLDVITLAYFAGELSASERVAVAATALTALVLGLMVAGRRLGLRRRVPSVIDLRDPAPRLSRPVAPHGGRTTRARRPSAQAGRDCGGRRGR